MALLFIPYTVIIVMKNSVPKHINRFFDRGFKFQTFLGKPEHFPACNILALVMFLFALAIMVTLPILHYYLKTSFRRVKLTRSAGNP